jgi:hypothetical protein
MMMIKCTKLYDPIAYSTVSILPTKFFNELEQWPWPFDQYDPEKQ